jgi:hypothetical protein
VLRWCAVVAVNLTAIAAILVAAEAYLRSRGHQPYLRTFPGQPQDVAGVAWASSDPVLGWTIAPTFLPGEVNPQGFRDARDFEHSPRRAGIARVMLLGDSFVVGAHLPRDQTLSALLEARSGRTHEVFSLAAPGWGVDQMYLAFERYKDWLDPDIVVLAFIDDDIKRVLEAYRSAERLTKPVLAVADGRLIRQEIASRRQQRLNQQLGRSVLASLVAREAYLAGGATNVVTTIVATVAQDMAKRQGRTIVVRIPTRDDGDAINQVRRALRGFESRFAGTAVQYVDAATEAADAAPWSGAFYVDDGHLNAAGTQRLADILISRIIPADRSGM